MTAIFVLWWITAPFCATNSVGIFSLLWAAQRFPFAASAEYGPSGRYSSNVLTGTSGTVLNVLLVIPALLMNVLPGQVDPHTVALQDDDQRRERFPAVGDEVHRALPARPAAAGCWPSTIPTIDAAGHPAGFASNVAAVHAFCSVVSRDGQLLGQFDLDARDVRLAADRPGGVGELRVEARTVRAARVPARGDRERGFERKALAAPDRERALHVRDRVLGARRRAGGDLLPGARSWSG